MHSELTSQAWQTPTVRTFVTPSLTTEDISTEELSLLRNCLNPIVGKTLDILRIPISALHGFEPSQIGSIVGLLMDACIPQFTTLFSDEALSLDLKRATSSHFSDSDHEVYPDYEHSSGKRLEMKLLYLDNEKIALKRTRTRREPSARLKVKHSEIEPSRDALLIVAYQLQESPDDPQRASPTIVDFEVFSMVECVRTRDRSLTERGGFYVGNTATIVSRSGRAKIAQGAEIDRSKYGRKRDGLDLNIDTNFGKLSRIPYPPLMAFLAKHGYQYNPSSAEVSPKPA